LIEKLDRAVYRKHADNDCCFSEIELVDELDYVGYRLLREQFADSDDTLVMASSDSFEKLIGWGH
jgi:hypothetical protein